jgi:zinc protease
MRRSEDNPRRHLMRHLYALALEGHPYSRPVIGTPELITPLARETLVAYYRRHYVPKPSRSSWWVTSTATPSLLLPVARSVACRAAAPVALPFPPHRRRKRDDWRCHAPIATPTRGSRGSLPPSIMPIWQPSIFLVAVLGDSRTSRLTQTLRDRLGASSPASAAPTPRSKARAR